MSARAEKDQRLVHAIVDAELDAAHVARTAAEGARPAGVTLGRLARLLEERISSGKETHPHAKAQFQLAFKAAVALALARAAKPALEAADAGSAAVAAASAALGPAVQHVAAVTSAEAKARDLERRGVEVKP